MEYANYYQNISKTTDAKAEENLSVPDRMLVPDTIPDDVATGFETVNTSLAKARVANASMLEGEIPDDVWKQIETRTAESAAMQGLGVGSMTGKKTARDLGLMSLQVQQQGIQTEAAIAQAQTQASTALGELTNIRDSLKIETAKLFEQARTSQMTAANMNILMTELQENTRMKHIEYLSGLAKARSDTQFSFYADDKGDIFTSSGAADTYDAVMRSIENSLKNI